MNDERPTMNDLSKKASEKITALHNDFGIDLTQEEEGDLEVMCNLGEGIYEDGLMKGKQEGWDGLRKSSKVQQIITFHHQGTC